MNSEKKKKERLYSFRLNTIILTLQYNKTFLSKNHRIISKDEVKVSHKIQNRFTINIFNKLGIEGNFLTLIKGLHKNPHIIPNGKNWMLSKFRNKSKMSTPTASIQHYSGGLNKVIRQEKEIKII